MLSIDAEIKVTITKDAVEPALTALALKPGDAERIRVCFAEDSPVGISPETRLFNEHLVFRARERQGDRHDDCTVKIRPCRPSQITDKLIARAAEEDSEFKLEADWAGDSRVLAASFTVELPGHPVAAALAQQLPLGSLFTEQQVDFLQTCADVPVNLEALTLLTNSVTALRWKPERFEGAKTSGKIRAERWTVGDLDFLEFSITAPVAKARDEQAKLISFLRSREIQVPNKQETKTQQVLGVLVGVAPATARPESRD